MSLAFLLCGLLLASSTTAKDDDLDRALETIEEHEIAADLRFLSSDELAGRGSPSPEQRIAARYLASRVERLGFQPAGDADTFFASYQLDRRALDLDATAFHLQGSEGHVRLAPREHWWYTSFPERIDTERTGRLVWIDEGRSSDLGKLDLTGAFAVAQVDVKSLKDREGPAIDFRLRPIADAAKSKGALGTLFVTDPRAELEGTADELDRLTVKTFLGSVSLPGQGRRQSNAGPLRVLLAPEATAQLLEACGLEKLPKKSGTELAGSLTESRTTWKAEDGSSLATLENVVALLPGTNSQLRDEVILVSAHYDHLGGLDGRVWNGADDNGTGTSVLLAMAESLVAYGGLDRSVMFLWVSAEEHGLLGSKAWCQNPTLPRGMRPIANLNIDMVGRNNPKQILLTPTRKMDDLYNGLAENLEKLASKEGFRDVESADAYYHRSDQQSFEEAFGIPVAFLFADIHEDYHQETDDFEDIDLDKVRRVARLATRALIELQGDDLDL